MIHPADKHPNLSTTARAIAEAKAALESAGDALQVEIAVRLCEAAEALSRVQESQERATPSEWMRHEDAARYLSTTPDGLYKESGVPRHKLGGKWMYNRRELDAWLLRR